MCGKPGWLINHHNIIVLIDDMGFGAPSTFGGPCQMPTLDRLAENGLTYNRFHTTALCSPTRQALLTGRNHHSAEMGSVAEVATGAPGYTSVRPNSVATVAEMLRCSTRHVYRLSDSGRMPAPIKLGVLVRWRRDELVSWIANGCPSCRRDGMKGGN